MSELHKHTWLTGEIFERWCTERDIRRRGRDVLKSGTIGVEDTLGAWIRAGYEAMKH